MPNEDFFEIKEVVYLKEIKFPHSPRCKLGQLIYSRRSGEYGIITKIEKIIYKDDTFEYILFALFKKKEIKELVILSRYQILREDKWEELDDF